MDLTDCQENPLQSVVKRHPILTDTIFATILAFFVCLFTCTSLSPLYPANNFDYLNGDSNLFRYLAWLWIQGKTPYIDFFDHKGLYHLAIDAIGLWIGGRYGIWFLEIVASAVNLFVLSRALRLLIGDSLRWRLFLYGSYFFLFALLGQGNSEGEWVLPFVNLFLFGYLKGIIQKRKAPFLWGSFAMGFEVGAALNSRPLDAMWGAMGAVFCCYYFLRKGDWKFILSNAFVAIIGCLIPFAVFYPLAIEGGYFSQMIAATYQQSGNYLWRHILSPDTNSIINRLIDVLITIFYIIAFRYLKKKKPEQKEVNFFFIFVGVGVSFLYFIVLGYFHYFQAGFGFFLLYLTRFVASLPRPKGERKRKVATWLPLFLALIYSTVFVAGYYSFGINDFSYSRSEAIAEVVDEAIPESDREQEGSVFAIDVDPSIYLDGNIIVSERFLAYTTWWAEDNSLVVPEINAYLSSSDKPKWLLFAVSEKSETAFQDVIDANYVLEAEPQNAPFVIYLAKSYQTNSISV